MSNPNQKIKSPQQIIAESGNSFHSRVVNLLRTEKWSVMVSPYYSDNFTDKPREIDIIAEKKFDVYYMGSRWIGTLDLRLFIECKYINGNTVFWFDKKDEEKVATRIYTDTGMKSPDDDIRNFHHLANPSAAKLFASEQSRNEDNELVNKAINQSLNALVYYRHRQDINFEKPEADKNKAVKVLRCVSYPIIVVNSFDHLFSTDMTDNTQKDKPIIGPFQLEINYAYLDSDKTGKNEYFLIDVVSIDKLQDFISMLEKKEVDEIRKKILWNYVQSARKRMDDSRESFF